MPQKSRHAGVATELTDRLTEMARRVESVVFRNLEALLTPTRGLAQEALRLQLQVTEMHGDTTGSLVSLLCSERLPEDESRRILCMLKTANDLERLARVAATAAVAYFSRDDETGAVPHEELRLLVAAVRSRISKALSAIVCQNPSLAYELLEEADTAWPYCDEVLKRMLSFESLQQLTGNVSFLLATRHLERLSDHAEYLAEEVSGWLGDLHGPRVEQSTR